MENFDEQEQMLMKQLEIVREKKKHQTQLKTMEDKLVRMTETIDNKKTILQRLLDEISELESDRVDFIEEISFYKTKYINKPVEQIPEPVVENNVEPLSTFESTKNMTHTELDDFKFWNKSVEVNMNEVQVGDYIQFYKNRDSYIGKVSRKTDKTIFIYPVKNSDCALSGNLSLHYDWKVNGYNERSYDYYYHNINNDNHLIKTEVKTSIKPQKIRKATNNFIFVKEFDWGA